MFSSCWTPNKGIAHEKRRVDLRKSRITIFPSTDTTPASRAAGPEFESLPVPTSRNFKTFSAVLQTACQRSRPFKDFLFRFRTLSAFLRAGKLTERRPRAKPPWRGCARWRYLRLHGHAVATKDSPRRGLGYQLPGPTGNRVGALERSCHCINRRGGGTAGKG